MIPRLILMVASVLLLGTEVTAQCPGSARAVFDGNRVRAIVNNSADRTFEPSENPLYEITDSLGGNALYANGFWIGGKDPQGNLHISAADYRYDGLTVDFGPGPIRSAGNYSCGQEVPVSISLDYAPRLALSDGRAMIFSATDYSIYDPATQQVLTFPLDTTRLLFNAVELPGNRVLVFGERNNSFPPARMTREAIIDLNQNTIAQTDALQLWHGVSSALLLSPDSLLIAGLAGVELYRPSLNTSTLLAPLNDPRHFSDMVALSNGNVMIGPGSNVANFPVTGVGTLEIYDPLANSWTTRMGPGNSDHTTELTPLDNGDILNTGGSNGQISIFRSDSFAAVTMLPYSLRAHDIFALGADSFAVVADHSNSIIDSYGNYDNFILNLNTSRVTYGPTWGFEGAAVGLGNGNILARARDGQTLVVDPQTLQLVDGRWEYIWKVDADQIAAFRSDFQAGQVDSVKYRDLLNWPAQGDPLPGESSYYAPFYDRDGDGEYDPVNDGDYPCIRGEQSLFHVFNDEINPNSVTQGVPLGVEVSVQTYGYQPTQATDPEELSTTLFMTYEIRNRSGTDYTDVHLGNWMDPTIGWNDDDYVGSDSLLNLAFAYNSDNFDEQYGAVPPAFGSVVLDSPDDSGMTNFMMYTGGLTTGPPDSDSAYYNFLRSRWRTGEPATYGGNGYLTSNQKVNYMFNGDPGFCGGPAIGWSEVSAGMAPAQRRMIQSVGPFDLEADEEVTLTVAYIWARADSGDHLSSVCQLKQVAADLPAWYAQQTQCSGLTPVSAANPTSTSRSITLFPNPSQGHFTIDLQEPAKHGGSLQLIDLQGRTVHLQTYPAGQQLIRTQVDGIASGFYLIQGISDGRVWQAKLYMD